MKKLASAYPARVIPKGTILLAPGQKAQGVYYLHSGSIRQYSISPQGNELTLHLLFEGAIFPAIAMYDNSETKYYYEAFKTSKVSIVPIRDFEDYLKDNTQELFEFTGRLLKGLDGLARRIEATSFGDSYLRVISILLYLARHFGESNGKNIEIAQKLTHQQIASFVGVTRERTSLELGKLQEKKLVNYKSGIIKIPDIKKLEKELVSKI